MDDEWADDLRDDEYPDPSDDWDDAAETVSCSECGGEIYEDTEQCPICGQYVTHATQISPIWRITASILVALLLFYLLWLLR